MLGRVSASSEKANGSARLVCDLPMSVRRGYNEACCGSYDRSEERVNSATNAAHIVF